MDRSNPETWSDDQRRQVRTFEVNRAAINADARTVELSFSSETPVERWFGMEILSHDAGAVRLARLNGGAPLLLNHDTEEQIGVVESATVSDGKGRAIVRFSKSKDGEEIFQDVVDGIRRLVSVGYIIHRTEETKQPGGVESVRVVDWEPYEISIVPIPADTNVGVGRSQELTTEQKNMSEPTTTPSPAPAASVTNIEVVREQTIAQERNRIAAIRGIAEQIRAQGIDVESDAADAINKGHEASAFQARAFDLLCQRKDAYKPSMPEGKDAQRDIGKFRLSRAIGALLQGRNLDGIEGEMLAEGVKEARNSGIGTQGNLVLPSYLMTGRRDLTATGGSNGDQGGITIATQTGPIIPLLYAASVLPQLGVQFLTGLTGNITFPTLATGGAGYHVAENTAPTESSPTFGSKTLSPNRLGTFVEVSKQLMIQSNESIEALLRNDLATAMSLAMENGAINGTGLNNQPLGLLGSGTGIGDVAGGTDGAAPDWADVVGLETLIATGNAAIGNLGYLTNPKVKGKLKTTEKASSTAQFVWGESNMLNGYSALTTTQVPSTLDKGSSVGVCSAILFGNWADLVVAMWGGVDIMVNPYIKDTEGLVRITVNAYYDTVIRRAASFAAMKDALTA